MTYNDELRRLKRATLAAQKRFDRRQVQLLACCVCSARPAPMTRFGPRCEEHRPEEKK